MHISELQRKRLLTFNNLHLLQKISQKGFWAILDQGLFAFSNFVLSIFLARLLSPTEYGIFSTALTIFYLEIVLHTSMLVEPMLVFGANKYQTDSANYQSAITFLHWVFSLINGVLLLVVAMSSYFLNGTQLVLPLIILSICCGFLLLPWLTRRLCYLSLSSKLAATTGLSHLIITLVGIAIIGYLNYVSWLSALILLSMTSLFSGGWILQRLKIPLFAWPRREFIYRVIYSHWKYGRWSLITGVLIWIPYNLSYFIVPFWYGIESNAALKAVNNLIVPAQQTFAALSIFLLPILSRQNSNSERDRLVAKLAIAFGGLSIAYWLFIGIFKHPLLWIMYDGNYSKQAQLLWILGLTPVATGITAVYGSALRSLEKPNYVFIAYLTATIVTVTIGIGTIYIWNLWGAVISLVLSMFSAAFVLVFFYYSKR